MISTELVSRIILTVIIVGVFSISTCLANASNTNTTTSNGITSPSTVTTDSSTNNKNEQRQRIKSAAVAANAEPNILDSPVATLSTSTASSSPSSVEMRQSVEVPSQDYASAETRLLADSAEAGILLPFDDDNFANTGVESSRGFYSDGNGNQDRFPSAVSFPARPIPLRVSNGKALEQPREFYYGLDNSKPSENDMTSVKRKPTYFLRNNCFGPRCIENMNKDIYFSSKEGKSKKYDGGSGSRSHNNVLSRLDDNIMESMSSNFHSQLAIPFVVVDDSATGSSPQSTYSKRSGMYDQYSRLTSSTSSSVSPEGWIKLKSISPDAYDPFRFSSNNSQQSTFSKRDSSYSGSTSNMLTKRVGVELNPESFADRWGWNGGNDDRRGGSRLPAWLEDQLKYGNRNSDQDKNWVKLEPIPVAGVTISKWVPKGTPVSELPTTSWQTNRDRPNGGSAWWDRIDDNRISGGGRPSFLRPGGDDGGRYPISGGSNYNSQGSPLSTFDRYPTNSWKDIIYPEGPQSATVSWQQSKGISNRPSSFAVSGGGGSAGWSAAGSDSRRPIVATGSWSAPPSTNRFPSFINRFNEHRSTSYPSRPSPNEDDPRWVLISNTRRVTSGSTGSGSSYNRISDFDRSKILSYINRLRPDLDRGTDYPFYDSSHRHGKDIWPYPNQKEAAFHRVNATLSTLTPVLIHRSGPAVTPQYDDISSSSLGRPSRLEALVFEGGDAAEDEEEISDGFTSPNNNVEIDISGSTAQPLFYSNYLGDGRATSDSVAAPTTTFQSSTSTPVIRNSIPGRIRQGLKNFNINPVYAAVGAGMLPATFAAVLPMMLGRRRRRRDTIKNRISQTEPSLKNHFPYFPLSRPVYSFKHKRYDKNI